MDNLIHVMSSNGEIFCNQDGSVSHYTHYEGGEGLDKIKSFDFDECRQFWDEDGLQSFDILELGGTNDDGSTFEPDHEYRNQLSNTEE